jgi:hypothetical protein
MIKSIEAVAPFQQSDIIKSFVGKRVSWSATLNNISHPVDGMPNMPYPVYVYCELLEGRHTDHDRIFCWASRNDADSLSNVLHGGRIRVTGTIRDVSGIGTTLEDCTFESDSINDS